MAQEDNVRVGSERERERQKWTMWAVAALSLAIFLLIALLMIGIPYLNARLVQGTAVTTSDLASWQVTALITMVGTLVAGVFIITAFRVDATAKQVAATEAGEAVDRELKKAKKRLKDQRDRVDGAIEKAESDTKEFVGQGRQELGKVIKDGSTAVDELIKRVESSTQETMEKAASDVAGIVQDAGIKTTAAIESETARFKQATQVALNSSEKDFADAIERIRSDSAAVREFLDEHAPGLVRESFTAEQMDAIGERVAERLTEDFLADEIAKAVRTIIEEEPQRFVDPVVERVAAMGRWRWLFRRAERGED